MEYKTIEYQYNTVLRLFQFSETGYHRIILKFNLHVIRYMIPDLFRDVIYVVDLTKCTDYNRYRRVYRLIYGI